MQFRRSIWWIGLTWITLMVSGSRAKEPSTLEFEFQIAGEPLALNQSCYLPSVGDSVTLRKVALYLGQIHWTRKGKEIARWSNEHLLLDAASPESLSIALPDHLRGKADSMVFWIGVDSTLQQQGAHGGTLDPMHGMYWTWKSGYIHVKIEGSSPQCPARKNRFAYHLGGYQAPHNSLRQVKLRVKQIGNTKILIHLDRFLNKEALRQHNQVMSPGVKATQMTDVLTQCFSLTP